MIATRRLINGSLFQLLRLLMQLAVSFVMMPIIIHSLGTRTYGFWTLAISFAGYYGLMEFGLIGAVVRHVSRAAGTGDRELVNRVASTAFFTYAAVGGVVLCAALAAGWGSSHFMVSAEEARTFFWVVVVMGLGVALSFPLRVFPGLLQARLRHDLQSLASMVRLVTANVCIYLALSHGQGIQTLAVIVVATDTAMYLAVAVMAFRVVPGLRMRFAYFSKQTLSELFSFGWVAFLARIGAISKLKMPPFLIAAFLNANQVTFFHIAARLLQMFESLVGSMVNTGGALFSWHDARGDYDALRTAFLNYIRLSSVISLFVGASIMFFGAAFIEAWMGPAYTKSYGVLAILALPAIVSAAQIPCNGLLYGTSRHRYLAVANAVEAAAGGLLSIALMPYFGIYGVAAALGGAGLSLRLFALPVYVCKSIGLPIQAYARTVGTAAVKVAPPLAAWFALCNHWVAPSFKTLFVLGGCQMVIFAPILFFFVLNSNDRKTLSGLLKSRTA